MDRTEGKKAISGEQYPALDESALAGRLREAGLKATPQRILILKEILQRDDHPTAEVIYKAVKQVHSTISFNTVYYTLQAFTEKELINILRPVVDAARYDPVTEIHGHFMCSECKRIEDQFLEDPNLKQLDSQVRDSGKYWVAQQQILWVGLCEPCRKEITEKE